MLILTYYINPFPFTLLLSLLLLLRLLLLLKRFAETLYY
jgi:ribonuclease HI